MKSLGALRFIAFLTAVSAVGGLTGCYDFITARREIRQNEEKVRTINAEIRKEQERKKELDDAAQKETTVDSGRPK